MKTIPLPPTSHTPAPYTGPSAEQVLALRKQYLNPGILLYYKQPSTRRASAEARAWTRELIDAALEQGGRYYLPYRLNATREQFRRAYPEAAEFSALKARVDPGNRFRNLLWDAYL